MEKLNITAPSDNSLNLAKIEQVFPSCITEFIDKEGKLRKGIDFEKLKLELSSSNDLIEEKAERYQFTWPDKNKAICLANSPINKTLRPCKEESLNFDTTENIYIEGDNLEVLKLLRETYLGKIKMIYIDPPYNTGNDFIYKDNFTQSVEEYGVNSGQVSDEGERLVSNTESNGRFHTDWLNMIYPRLKVARDLLTDDGVIFISIDDNEVDNLRKICNEIFGETNNELLIWNKESEGSSGTLKSVTTTRRIHEYILCSFKSKKKTQYLKVHEALKGRENEFQTANLAVNQENEKINHPNYFTITNPFGDKFTNQWKWGKDEINRLIKENLIYWGSDGHKKPRLIIPTDERRTTFLLSILEYGGTTTGRKDFEQLMGSVEFSYPKPIILIKKLIETATKKDSLVLDFFSGSATTAHAIMQLNSEDGGNRKFIMVQLPEKTSGNSEAFKAGYKTICDIGKERIRRAGKKIIENLTNTGSSENTTPPTTDIGFRVFKLDSSNMEDVGISPNDINPEIDLFADNIKANRSSLDLLIQVMLQFGIELSTKIETKNINSKDVFFVNNNYLIACFDENIDESIIIEIAKLKPLYFVMRDSSVAADNVIDNFEQIFNEVSESTRRYII